MSNGLTFYLKFQFFLKKLQDICQHFMKIDWHRLSNQRKFWIILHRSTVYNLAELLFFKNYLSERKQLTAGGNNGINWKGFEAPF